jgi:hypothetical protein
MFDFSFVIDRALILSFNPASSGVCLFGETTGPFILPSGTLVPTAIVGPLAPGAESLNERMPFEVHYCM